ncbi:hypothetical protein [Saccharopolyspora sp. NPDC049426]|uniref:hypothetical protein n=1 Tax=Saccharopolyspora sp. NPDC049426 TaxID=3155652 RepID=UPI0034196D3A
MSQNLERARQRNAEQLAEQKKREQLVEDNLVEFVDAGVVIAAEQAALEDKVAVLHRKIDQAHAESTERVAGEHARQAAAAWAIHEHGGRSAAQVAELLELRSEKEARRLINTGRTGAVNQDSSRARATGEQEPGTGGDAAEQYNTGAPDTSIRAVVPHPTILDHDVVRQDGQRDTE